VLHETNQQRRVVGICDVVAVDALARILLQLLLEDVLVEEVLQLLIGKVDAPLLEAVDMEVFKAKNIKDTWLGLPTNRYFVVVAKQL